MECKTVDCKLIVNYSRVLRGEHHYLFWEIDQFQDKSECLQTFTVIPLTFQETCKGLPTAYPINSTSKNGLDRNSLALVHQIFTIDANCFKDSQGNWFERVGQVDKGDKESIEERLKYFLNLENDSSDDWLIENVSVEVLEKVFDYLPKDMTKKIDLEKVISDLELW
ncbi:MAG: type II toxin-antitoxin system PemK/MazF family toxin [Microcoleus sp. PH2017_01_SCD_O_A]|nr:type II toxin-antitoxin system PemK/MazF family toxin [Microcoleus sp. PH2017_01_SCD_O_A]MCC3425333.1 type II toxin-antitoxin system PemK/MazF family toxin [Microcoleus sp. PH2017_01_SCD_O_A]MCC3491564.1 type II toxin-antitoxin system PemK/MazF family toxin [Microcoleus sp. PH2017_16_JOR_D_A]